MTYATAGLIRVTPDQLATVSGQLRAGSAGIDAELGRLAGSVAPLGSEWAGLAQQRFQALWEQWRSSSRALQQALTDLATLMQGAAADYAANEAAVAARFGR
jgi:WXG100 family type VII secretion target